MATPAQWTSLAAFGKLPLARNSTVAAVLLLHAAVLAYIAGVQAPMYDEIAHLPSGIHHWQTGRFDLYKVNPPLARMVAALPVLIAGPKFEGSEISNHAYARPEFPTGRRFAELNGTRTPRLFALGRWACIPFSLLGGWICYRWAGELFGTAAGWTALVTWCFCPNLLAWGATLTPDAAAASMGVAAGYGFWRWLRQPAWRAAALAGVALGLAELTKSTWILLFALWPCLWLTTRGLGRPRDAKLSRRQELGQLLVILLLGVYLLNLGYGFEGSFRSLGSFDFISSALGGQLEPRTPGNRFRDAPLAWIPLPLPANYVQGIDVQRYDFEVGKWSYLRGEQKLGGWWYYYLYALAVKTPLGTLGLAGLAVLLAFASRTYRIAWRDELVPLSVAIAVLVLVSSQTGFNRYLRYVLPVVPFLLITISRVGRAIGTAPRPLQIGVLMLLGATVVGSLRVAPHSMSFFNLAAGGPLGGPRHLLDANIDWGQDLLHLQQWIDAHPQARPFHLQYFGFLKPETIGIQTLPVPQAAAGSDAADIADGMSLQPGWYAISVNDLYGYRHYGRPRDEYTYFQQLEPIDRAGYSIYIYQLTADDVRRIRKELGLPDLQEEPATNP